MRHVAKTNCLHFAGTLRHVTADRRALNFHGVWSMRGGLINSLTRPTTKCAGLCKTQTPLVRSVEDSLYRMFYSMLYTHGCICQLFTVGGGQNSELFCAMLCLERGLEFLKLTRYTNGRTRTCNTAKFHRSASQPRICMRTIREMIVRVW